MPLRTTDSYAFYIAAYYVMGGAGPLNPSSNRSGQSKKSFSFQAKSRTYLKISLEVGSSYVRCACRMYLVILSDLQVCA